MFQSLPIFEIIPRNPKMDAQFRSTQNRQQLGGSRKKLTEDQVRLLETSFNANQKLELECKLELARKLGVPPRQVAIWYQNRRARQKVETIEFDYKTIQLQLENVLAEKNRLEQEVRILKDELSEARHMILALTTPCIGFLPSATTSDDNELASVNSPSNMVLPTEEMYSFLTGPEGQPENWGANDGLVP